MSQLALEGTDVPVEAPTASVPVATRMGYGQRRILQVIGRDGFITSTAAGVIVHEERGHCGHGRRHAGERSAACCGYAAADGLEAMKRLMKRNLVVRDASVRGRWVRP